MKQDKYRTGLQDSPCTAMTPYYTILASTMAVANISTTSSHECIANAFLLISASPLVSVPSIIGIIECLFKVERDKAAAFELALEIITGIL